MKTKLVYAVVSGIDDIYLAQAALSAFTAKHYNPDSVITLVVDDRTDSTIIGSRSLIMNYITEKVVVDMPEHYNNKVRSRVLKTNLRNYIKGDYLFIDTDTLICQPLDECDKFDFSIGAVLDFHVPLLSNTLCDNISRQIRDLGHSLSDKDYSYFNSGVFYVKDNEVSHKLYSEWNRIWNSRIEKGLYTDQQPLAVANARCGYVIHELPGEWNCQILVNGLPFLATSRIIHFFSSGSSNKLNTGAYLFTDNSIFKNINDSGKISVDIQEKAINGRSAFYKGINMRFVAGDGYETVYNSDVIQFVIKQRFRHPSIYRMMQKMVKIYDKIIKFKNK